MNNFAKLLKRFKRKLSRVSGNYSYKRLSSLVDKISELPDFPSSACSNAQYLDLTLIGAQQSYQLVLDATKRRISYSNLDAYLTDQGKEFSSALKSLFVAHGSDKSTSHNYHEIYGQILSELGSKKLNILEIGLGTNNPDTPSNMGVNGKPGASLRAWREFSPETVVVGADIDERILFQEERISTYALDQLSDEAWEKFKSNLVDQQFDLIIDDGLHSPAANLKTIKYLLSFLKPNGSMVIEDVAERTLPIWELFSLICPPSWSVDIVKSKNAFVVIIKVTQI